MFEVWRTETWGDRIHWSSVFSASRSGVLWEQDLHKGRVSLHQIQWPLFCDYPHLLSVTGIPWDGPFLSGTHRHCRGETTDPGWGGNLVDCGHCSPSEWNVDTRWWQQLGAILLKQISRKTIFETPVCFNMLKACFNFFLHISLKKQIFRWPLWYNCMWLMWGERCGIDHEMKMIMLAPSSAKDWRGFVNVNQIVLHYNMYCYIMM